MVSGITGFGIGSALGGIGGAAAEGSKQAAISEAGKAASGEVLTQAGKDALANTFREQGLQAAGVFTKGPVGVPTVGENLGQIFSKEGITALTSPQALIAAGVGEGTNMQTRSQEAMEKFNKAGERMGEAELARQGEAIVANQFNPNLTPAPYDPGGTDYGAQYANAGGIVSLDPSDFRKRFNGLMEMGAPIVGMQMGGGIGNIDFGNQVGVGGYGNAIPAQQQAALRDPYIISPGQLQDVYAQQGMPGFGPEIMYFTPEKGVNPNPFKDWVPDPIAAPLEGGGEGDGTTGSETAGVNTTDEFIVIDLSGIGGGRTRILNPNYLPPEGESAAETTTETTSAPAAGSGLSAEDYIDLYDKYINYGGNFNISPFAEGGETQVNSDADRLIDLAAMAVSGQMPEEEAAVVIQAFIDEFGEAALLELRVKAAILGELPEEEAGVAIQAFIDEFGEEAFSALRESVLEGIVPGSQKEGEIVGPRRRHG